jgi:hypothetical protein
MERSGCEFRDRIDDDLCLDEYHKGAVGELAISWEVI